MTEPTLEERVEYLEANIQALNRAAVATALAMQELLNANQTKRPLFQHSQWRLTIFVHFHGANRLNSAGLLRLPTSVYLFCSSNDISVSRHSHASVFHRATIVRDLSDGKRLVGRPSSSGFRN